MSIGLGKGQLSSVNGIAPFNASGVGAFVSNGRFNMFGGESAGLPNNSAIVASPNAVTAIQFVLLVPMILSRLTSMIPSAAGAAGTKYGFAIYDRNKNLLLQVIGLDCTNTSTVQSVTFPSILLQPGVYYFAQTSSDSATFKMPAYSANNQRQIWGNSSPFNRTGISSNAFSAGSFPASLGTLDGSNVIAGIVQWEAA